MENATAIYTDDEDIKRIAGDRFTVTGILDLPLPPEDAQSAFDFEPGQETDTPESIAEDDEDES